MLVFINTKPLMKSRKLNFLHHLSTLVVLIFLASCEPDNVVEPKPPFWPPGDEAFEAKPITKPLDDPQASFLLKKPPDEACQTTSPPCTL